jgi:hypothetical protein
LVSWLRRFYQKYEFVTNEQQLIPVDVGYLSEGTYLIELRVGTKRAVAKLIVQ